MAKSLKTSVSARNNICKPLRLVDVECPVCREIFIEPVTLPCKHRFCLQCFDGTMESVSLQCPMCRTRVGGWLRTATKDNRVVDKKLWDLIQRDFSEYVQAKRRGEGKRLVEDVHPICISKPGEVRQEYELQKIAIEEETRRQREKESRASVELIKKLQEEEQMELAKKALKHQRNLALDEEIARKLMLEEINRLKRTSPNMGSKKNVALSSDIRGCANQPNRTDNKENKALKSSSTVTKGPMDAFLGKKKASCCTKKLVPIGTSDNIKPLLKSDRTTDGEKDRSASGLSTGSCDSINQEMHHFKPIKVAPRTPPKKMPDGRIIEPKVVKITPVHLNFSSDARSGKLPVENSMITSQLESKYVPLRTNVVRELFQSGKSSSEPRGPSAFCGTGALESDICMESSSKDICPNESKARKLDPGHLFVAEENLEVNESKMPSRTRKRKIPCSNERKDDLMEQDPMTSFKESKNKIMSESELELTSVPSEMIEEQLRREAQLQQELRDLELARELQRKWESEDSTIDRRKGSRLEYHLRSRETKGKSSGKSKGKGTSRKTDGGIRQQSLDEVFKTKMEQ